MGARRLEVIQPRGFYNLGNTCYLGSLVQALAVLESLVNPLKNYASYSEKLTQSSDITKKQKGELKLIKELYEILIPLMNCQTAPPINPLYSAICNVDKNFGGNGEQDVHELLVMLTTAVETISDLRDQHYRRPRGSSFSRFPMHFEIETSVRCHECRTETKSKERSVDVESEVEVDHWRAFKSVESLSGANQYHCDKCKKKVDASKTARLLQPPQILALHYKVFKMSITNGSAVLSKIQKVQMPPFVIPLNEIDVNHLGEYQLSSMIVHAGSNLDRGHYVCIRPMDSDFRVWEMYNDQHHYKGTLDDMANSLANSTPYLMFYEKYESETDDSDVDSGSP